MRTFKTLRSTLFSGLPCLLALGSTCAVSGTRVYAQPEPPEPNVPDVALPVAPVANNGESITLASKLPAGFTYETSVTADARRMVHPIGQKVMSLYERTVIVTRSQVLDVSPEGVSNVENEFRSIKLHEASGNTTLLDYDSTQPLTNNQTPQGEAMSMMGRIYAPLIGKKYRVRVAADGNVLEVSGITEMTDEVMDAIGKEGVPADQIANIRADFERSFGGDRLREHFYSVSELPPLTPVRVNEPWTRRFLSGDADLPLVVRSTGSIAQRTGDEIVIYERGDLALDESATELGKSKIPIQTEFTGTHRGGTRLDLAHNQRTSRLRQQYYVSFTYDAPSAFAGSTPKQQQYIVQGTTYYLIEVRPVTTQE